MFHCDLSLNIWCVCVCVCVCMCFYLFPTVLSVSAPFLPSLIASNQLIYDFCKWVIFEEKRQISKENVWYQWKCLIAPVTTRQIVLIYIYMDVSVYWPMCVLCVFVHMCVFVCVCDTKSEYQPKPHYVSDLSKPDASLYKIHTKVLLVLRFQGLTCIDPSYH